MNILIHSREWNEGAYIVDLFKSYLSSLNYNIYDIGNDLNGCDLSLIPNIQFDMAFGWGLSDTLKHVRDEMNVPIFIFDLGMIKRCETPITTNGYFRCGFMTSTWVDYSKSTDSSRWDMLNIDFSSCVDTDGYISFMGQFPNDVSHGMNGEELVKWTDTIITKILNDYPNNKIIYKCHPHARSDPHHQQYKTELQNRGIIVDFSNKRIEQMDVSSGYKSVFAYCSTSLIHFIIHGIPVVASKTSMFSDMVSDIDSDFVLDFIPDNTIKSEWFNSMAFSQWNKNEISNGVMWNHIKKLLL